MAPLTLLHIDRTLTCFTLSVSLSFYPVLSEFLSFYCGNVDNIFEDKTNMFIRYYWPHKDDVILRLTHMFIQ